MNRMQLQPCVQPRSLTGIVLDPQLRRPMHGSGSLGLVLNRESGEA
jgi:hypothetical protein